MTEEWRPVVGFEGHYEVSELGNIHSVDRTVTYVDGRVRHYVGALRRTPLNPDGYPVVVLSKQGVNVTRSVHSLVAAAFLGLRPDGSQVRHKDGNEADPRACNLQYGTKRENELDKRRHGTHHESNRTECPAEHQLAEPNLVRSVLAAGRRGCLACARARAYLQDHPEADFRTTADRYYAEIMRELAA